MSIIKAAGNKILDVNQYLKEASADRSIKYGAEKGAKHHIFIIPEYTQVIDEATGATVQMANIRAISQKIHDWNDTQGNYNSTVCLEGLIAKDENGEIINDGECPICKRVSAAWDIYNMRKDAAEAQCTLPAGKAREDYLKKIYEGFRNELKAKEAKPYAYVLIAVFPMDKEGAPVLDDKTKLPTYTLKVMKLSVSRLTAIQKQLTNSGAVFAGSELVIEYSNSDSIMNQVGESTISLVLDKDMYTRNYEGLFAAIYGEAEEFDFETIDKAFKEWQGMSTAVAQLKMDKQFLNWDAYQKELETNPNAVYLEYNQATANPNLGNAGAPQMYNQQQMGMNQTGMLPQMGQQMPMMGQMQNQMPNQMPMMGQQQGQVQQGQVQQVQQMPLNQGAVGQGQVTGTIEMPDPNAAFGVGIKI